MANEATIGWRSVIGRLRALGDKRVPFVQQLSPLECGAACLAMALAYHGRTVGLTHIREAMAIGRDGANALAVLNAADKFGLRGRGVRLDIDDLEYLDPGSVLHWNLNHFVIFERLWPSAVDIVDPAHGRRRVPMTEFAKSFSGIALLLEPGETFVRGKDDSSSQALRRQIVRALFESGTVSRIVVTSIFLQLFSMAIPALTAAVVDRVVPRQDTHLMLVLGAALFGVTAFYALSTAVRNHFLLQLRTIVDTRLTLSFLDHLFQLPFSYFQQHPAGDLMMRMNSTETIREALTSAFLSGVADTLLLVVFLVTLVVISPPMALLVVVLGALQIASFAAVAARRRRLLLADIERKSKAQSYQVELLTGMETLKALGCEQQAAERWADLFVDVVNLSLQRGRLNANTSGFTSALRLGAPLVILFFGASQCLAGSMTLGTMLAVAAIAGSILGPLENLVDVGGQLQMLQASIERLTDIVDTAPEQDRAEVRTAPPIQGAIELKNVRFRYNAVAPYAVDGVSVKISPGQFVAIVGRSGSGKTSLASLMLGLFRPEEGHIMFDHMSLAELDLRSLRRQIGIVVQQPYLFQGTIRSNITLADPSLPMDRVIEAARLAEIHDEISQMPMGYETILVGAGTSLSGGQRQRLAIARALVRKPALLLLDEATSALDSVTEARIQARLTALACTRIVIAHRLSTIRAADVILVMDGGRLVESGCHDELMAGGGVYPRLVNAQLVGDN